MQFAAPTGKCRHIVTSAVVGLIIAAGLAAPSLLGRGASGAPAAAMATTTASTDVKDSLRLANDLSAAFKQAARTVAPAVVHITSTQHAKMRTTNADPSDAPDDQVPDELFRRFFGDQNPGSQWRQYRFGPGQPQEEPDRSGMGAGLIIRDDGYIVTNNHVVDGADEVKVKLNDKREYTAKVIGTDPESDVAVIKIDGSGLPAAQFGDSEKLEVGEWVLAIGNPFGYDQTVTAGIVSATGRGAIGDASFATYIQTDAAINPGNSGGPLLTLDGKVVGINTWIATTSGSFSGLGFAIPATLVRSVTKDIIEHGKVSRGWLGIVMQELEPALAESFAFKGDGVLVGRVVPDSPAAKAGLKQGDIIAEVNGKPVKSIDELRSTVANNAPGATVSFDIFRSGKRETIKVTLGERDINQLAQFSGPNSTPVPDEKSNGLGIAVQTVTDAMARRLNLHDVTGVVVTEVARGSRAAKAGLQPGDVIDQVGDKPVANTSDLAAAMDQTDKDDAIRLHVISQGAGRFVLIKATEN